jgi:hypothetical protein
MLLVPKRCPACGHKPLAINEDNLTCENCFIYTKPLTRFQKFLVWASSKWWWWRALILAWFVIMLVQNLHNPWFAVNRLSNPFSALDLGIHELGHILFIPFGQFMHIAGGCLFQCLFPIIGIAAFIQIRWYFAAIMCLPWLGLNLFDVAMYAGDARDRLLPLTTGFAGLSEQGSNQAYDKAHDWYQILSRLHHLDWDHRIEHILRIAATSVTILGLVLGSLLVIYMLANTLSRFLDKRKKTLLV